MKIFLTGGAGVVGVPLMRSLGSRHHVVALSRNRPVAGAAEQVGGDLTKPRLGLSQREWDSVVDGLDCVVHCAANVDFAAGPETLTAVNVHGPERIVELARAASARIVHVSTAFVDYDMPPDSTGGYATLRPGEYILSKRAGEQIVRASGLPHAIVRPSAIGGDSATGDITEYQGVHSITRAMLKNSIPLFLCAASARYDLIPCDVVAAVVAAVAEDPAASGVFWATVGPESMTADRLLEIVADTAADCGVGYRGTRRADPEMFERLLKPAFFDDLTRSDKTKMANLMTTLAALFPERPMPTSLGSLPGVPQAYSASDADDVMRTTLRYVIGREGLGDSGAVPALRKEVVA